MLRETMAAQRSFAATKPAGALAARSHRGPTWMTRRAGEVLCSSGDEGPRRQQWRPRGEDALSQKNEPASSRWSLRGLLMTLEKGIELRVAHRPRRRRIVLAAEKWGNSKLAPLCK